MRYNLLSVGLTGRGPTLFGMRVMPEMHDGLQSASAVRPWGPNRT